MALFKIFKGTDVNKLQAKDENGKFTEVAFNDGYCYFDTTTGLFFIDAEIIHPNGKIELTRAPINAGKAIYDINGNKIDETYLVKNDLLNENNIIKQEFFPEGFPYSEYGYGVLYPETTVFHSLLQMDDGVGGSLIPELPELIEGQEYKIIFNGVEYTSQCTGYSEDGVFLGWFLGMNPMNREGATTYPFCIGKCSSAGAEYMGLSENQGLIAWFTGESQATFAIVGEGEIITKIDSKYLPYNSEETIVLNMDTQIASASSFNYVDRNLADMPKICAIIDGQEYAAHLINKNMYGNIEELPAYFYGVVEGQVINAYDDFGFKFFTWIGSQCQAGGETFQLVPPVQRQYSLYDNSTFSFLRAHGNSGNGELSWTTGDDLKDYLKRDFDNRYLISEYLAPEKMGIGYGVSSDSATTINRTVNIPDFIPCLNGMVMIKFESNVINNSVLSINGGEARQLLYNNENIPSQLIQAGDICLFINTELGYELININSDITQKANLNSPVFSGIPTVPTPAEEDSSMQIANTIFITNKIAKVVDGASDNYNTLKKIENQVKLKADPIETIAGELIPCLYAGSSTTGGPANSVQGSISFRIGGKEKGVYNGSNDPDDPLLVEVNAVDLNISGALKYIGRTNNQPVGTVITLVSGNEIIAEPGNVVIWTEGNVEYLLDDNYEWILLGEASSFSLAPHIHGNVSNQGYLTNAAGIPLANKILTTDGTGLIQGNIGFSNVASNNFLNENGEWLPVNGDNYYHTTGSWGGTDNLTYSATSNGGAPEFNFTLPTASTSNKGVVKIGSNISVNSGTISITKANVETALGFTPLSSATKYALSDNIGGDALAAKKLASTISINGMSFDGSTSISNYGVCGTAAETAAKTVAVGSAFTLATGAQVVVKFTNANSIANPTLNVNSTGAKPIYRYGTTAASTGTATNGWVAGAVQRFTYDGTGWIMDYWNNSTYYTSNVHCTTAGETAEKVGSTSYYDLGSNRYFIVMMTQTNSYAGAITLNINSKGAKPIYINGAASSSSNYTLPAGIYFVYYDGINYYFRTDGGIQGGSFYGTASSASTASKVTVSSTTENSKYYIIGATGTGSQSLYRAYNASGTQNTAGCYFNGSTGVLYGAAWNDYAEYRITKEEIEPGRCVIENGDDTLSLSTERLQRGCEIVSDTFGFAIGETEESKTPIAATGRVLCYLLEGREEAKSHIGWPVCSGPNGTVSIMTEEEEEKYPSRIIGIISAVPDYEEWGSGNVKVNGRVWIRIK